MTHSPKAHHDSDDKSIILAVQRWLEKFVVGMNLCPFAKNELQKDRVRIVTTRVNSQAQLLMSLQTELGRLKSDSSIETTLLIHPDVLRDFYDYNDFLTIADILITEMGLEGIFQVASFHPDYQFEGTQPDDAQNYTNRSPYPMLHLLREASLEHAIAQYPDVAQIPTRNVALMNKLGQAELSLLFAGLFEE